MMTQNIIALVVVAVAVGFLARGVVRAIRGRGKNKCSGGCCK